MRLIDADKIMADIAISERSTSKDYTLLSIARYIRIQPTIDAEPVVHCKDCHYAKPYNKIWYLPKKNTLVCTYFADEEVDKYFFCGCAIKKMDEETT